MRPDKAAIFSHLHAEQGLTSHSSDALDHVF